MSQEVLLKLIRENPGISPKQLCELSDLSNGTVYKQLKGLRRDRLVERIRVNPEEGHGFDTYYDLSTSSSNLASNAHR